MGSPKLRAYLKTPDACLEYYKRFSQQKKGGNSTNVLNSIPVYRISASFYVFVCVCVWCN